MQRPSVYANQSPSGTLQLSPSLSGFSRDIDFLNPLPPLCPHSCHHYHFPPWPFNLQVHCLRATSTASKIVFLMHKSDHADPVLETRLWLPTACKITSKFLSTAFQALPRGPVHPSRLIPHFSLISLPCHAPAPHNLYRPPTIFLTSSLESPGAPLPHANCYLSFRAYFEFFLLRGAKLLSSKLSWVFLQGSPSSPGWSLWKLIIVCFPLAPMPGCSSQ